MGHRIHKKNDEYRLWSSTTDSYITPPMSRDRMIDFFIRRTAVRAVDSAAFYLKGPHAFAKVDDWEETRGEWEGEEEYLLHEANPTDWDHEYTDLKIPELDRVFTCNVERRDPKPVATAQIGDDGIRVVVGTDLPKGTVLVVGGDLMHPDGLHVTKIENVGDPE